MKQHFLFTLSCFLFLNILCGQEQPSNHQIKKALDLYKEAEAAAHNLKNGWQGYIQMAEKALPPLEQTDQWEPYFWTLNGLMNSYYYISDFRNSLQKAQQIEERIYDYPISAPFLYDQLLRLGVYYAQIINYSKSEEILERASEMADREGFNKASVYHNFGFLNHARGDYQHALDYYELSLEERIKVSSIDYNRLANTHNNLGAYYQELEMFEKAGKHLQLSMDVLSRIGLRETNQNYLASNYLYQGINFQKLGKYELAHQYLTKIFDLSGIFDSYYSLARHHLGINYHKRQNTKKAIEILKETLKERRKLHSFNHTNIAKSSMALGDIYWEAENSKQALQYYQLSIASLVKGFVDTVRLEVNPTIDMEIISKLDLLKVLPKKAKALLSLGYGEEALSTYELATDVIYAIRQDIFSSESKLLLSKRATIIYEEAIDLALTQFQHTKDQVYLEKVFTFCEKNKSTLLLENILEAEALGSSNLPSYLLKELQTLQNKITLYQRNLTLLDAQKNPDTYGKLNNQKLLVEEELQQLYRSLELDYPEYYQMRYKMQPPTINEIQKKVLNSKTMLLEYFVGQNQLFIIGIHTDQVIVKTVNFSTKERNQIKQLLQYFSDGNAIIEDPLGYQQLSHKLYKTFITPVLDNQHSIETLWIIPDGALAYIPFDALVTLPNSDPVQHPHYLIEDCKVMMAYSGTMLVEERTKLPTKGKQLLVVAPGFYNKEHGLSPLINSHEVIKAVDRNSIKVLMNEQANIGAFRQMAPQYPYLHLSTHAVSNNVGKDPHIYFIDSVLYQPEIYGMELNAKLLVLDGCETNIGEMAQGEGVLSLARAFSHAGVRHLISTLWKVPDKSISAIFQQFYHHLEQGQTPDNALHEAKLDFLKDTDRTVYARSPYYWASLVFISNELPASKSTFLPIQFLVGLAILLGIGIFFFFYRSAK